MAMRWRAINVLTNTPTRLFQRSPGEMQGVAIVEQAITKAAKKLGIDPIELRKINAPAGIAGTLDATEAVTEQDFEYELTPAKLRLESADGRAVVAEVPDSPWVSSPVIELLPPPVVGLLSVAEAEDVVGEDVSGVVGVLLVSLLSLMHLAILARSGSWGVLSSNRN